jgi:putative endonuclease
MSQCHQAPALRRVEREHLHGPVALLSHSLINRQPRWLYGRASMPTRRQILGSAGERLALEHYERLGFELLAANHRTRAGELDLIVADRRTIVFVEVKTRRAGGLDPLVSLTAQKRRRLRRLAAAWLADHPDHPRRGELRFDGVAVVLDENGALVALEQIESIT